MSPIFVVRAVVSHSLYEGSWGDHLGRGGSSYIDFLVGSGALNYGHNNPNILAPAIEYLAGENTLLSLDMHTAAKRDFIEAFEDWILKPRSLFYKIQFPGLSFEFAKSFTGSCQPRSSIMASDRVFRAKSRRHQSATADNDH
ncbi:hypothetical protein [Mesorhizobium escarrei]|uniref:Aminotransferase class III-fold pyridoxal phosphate-dependent enzyme n=1 Tax=Mesorhizobium escarrei TaxID=666018 RepID=A0ABM9E7F0_9HYPH|nr:hypothetical protein MES5069_450040 [Mesorhizobium escarrei]